MATRIAETGRRARSLETLLSLAPDRTLNPSGAPGPHLRIPLVSDGLQNSPAGSVYGRGVAFPSPAGHPLERVIFELVILRNPRDAAIQARGVARLVDWSRAAHAEVVYDPPRWLAVTR